VVINCCFDGRHFTCGCAAEHPHERKECGMMKTMVDVIIKWSSGVARNLVA